VISAGPRVVVDGGHNQAALRQAGESLRRLIRDERLVIVFGMLSERDPNQLLPQLRAMKPAAVVFTEPASAAGHVIAASTLSEMYGRSVESIPRAAEALARARELAGADGTVLVCGSLYLAGEVLALTGAAADPRPG
jgi:dihydrofolate synthase/folylpolyglutamate synthase